MKHDWKWQQAPGSLPHVDSDSEGRLDRAEPNCYSLRLLVDLHKTSPCRHDDFTGPILSCALILFIGCELSWRRHGRTVLPGTTSVPEVGFIFGRSLFETPVSFVFLRFVRMELRLLRRFQWSKFQIVKMGHGEWTSSRWWFQGFFVFSPIWGSFPFGLIFFKWVETTNWILTFVEFSEAFPLGVVLNYALGLVCSRPTRLWSDPKKQPCISKIGKFRKQWKIKAKLD